MNDSLIKDKFKLPENWEINNLENLTNLIIDGTHHTPTYTEYGVPFLRVTDVQTKEIDKESLKYISKADWNDLDKVMPHYERQVQWLKMNGSGMDL